MHDYIQFTELYLYVGHGYFNAFCMCIHKLLGQKVHYNFSWAYSVDPNTNVTVPPNTQVIPYEVGDLYEEEPLHQWYCPKAKNSNIKSCQYSNATIDPSEKVTSSNITKLPVTDPL